MINVSCIQFQPIRLDLEANIAKMEHFIRKVMSDRPETTLLVFPELSTSGYECTREEFQSLGEKIEDGRSLKAIATLCKEFGIHIIYGFIERDHERENVLYNSAALVDQDGKVLGCYRKMHPFDTEKQWCHPGSEYPVFHTKLGDIAIMICWDTAFPEVARTYALKGADILIVCSNWEKPYAADWDLVTSARAFDNIIPLVAANRVGQDKNLDFFGRSRILDSLGRVITSLDEDEEGVIHASLDLFASKTLRDSYYTFFTDRRPDTYGELVVQAARD